MSQELSHSETDGIITINLPEIFNFESYVNFNITYSDHKHGDKYIIDFKRTTFIDSSALGMLMVLKQNIFANNEDIHKNYVSISYNLSLIFFYNLQHVLIKQMFCHIHIYIHITT